MSCPQCGGQVLFGYGLAGGGVGKYDMCMEDDCDWFSKTLDADPQMGYDTLEEKEMDRDD